MIRRALLSGLAALGLSPALADTLDDAACGMITEYVMDLAYDMGAPMALAPEGRIWGTGEACKLSYLLIEPGGPAGAMVEHVSFGGAGLQDWVAGKGWPSEVTFSFDRAYIWNNIPELPVFEWASRLVAKRQQIGGYAALGWDQNAGRLTLEALEVGARGNWVRLAGEVSGVAEGSVQASLPNLRLHALDAQFEFDGMFEGLVLMPFGVGMMEGAADPAARFGELVALAQTYVAALPAPQVDQSSALQLSAFLDALPSPTGRLALVLKGGEGVKAINAVPLVAGIGAPTPEAVGQIIGGLLGDTRVTVQWQAAAQP